METKEIKYEKSPVRAIRAKCVECFGGEVRQVANCSSPKCPLYPFRFGKNPYTNRRELTDDEKNALRERLAAARQSK